MSSNSRFPRRIVGLAMLPLALATALCMQDAQASAFQLKENSVAGMGRAFAGGPASPDDCSVVVNNPAAMPDLGDLKCAQADLNIINFSTKFRGGGEDALGRPLIGGNGGNGGVTKPVPATYFTMPFSDALTLGAAISAPYGFQTGFEEGWAGRYEALESKLQSIALTFSAGYRVSDEFSIGGSIVAQHTSANLTQAVDFGTILMSATNGGLLPQEADGFGAMKGDAWGVGFQLSALWKPTPNDRVGINFHSQIDHTLEGTSTFYVPANLRPYFATPAGNAFTSGPGKADYDTPWYVDIGWWHTVNDRFSFGIDAAYTNWESFKELDVRYGNPAQAPFAKVQHFDWESTWFFSFGGDYRLNDRWTLRAGVGFDQTPTIDATRTPRVPDGDRTWLSFGASYKYSDQITIDMGLTHLWVDDAKIDHTATTFSRLVGHHENTGNILGISGQYRF